jgi:hypothetical protein
MNAEETPLTTYGGGSAARAHLDQGVVLRDAGPWSRSVIALLKHFESVGFRGAPRVVGDGFWPDGREAVTFMPGSNPHPRAWPDDALVTIGALLRDMHEASASFAAPSGSVWKPWFGRELPGTHPVIGHCDTGPWNIVADTEQRLALIDWEFAGPVDAIWELAHTAWLNAQLHDDDIAERFQLPSAEQRAKQMRLLVEGYGLAKSERNSFVDKVIAIAVLSARDEAIQHDVGPDSKTAVGAGGYPVMWAITWRTRSAGWMLQNRGILERSLG